MWPPSTAGAPEEKSDTASPYRAGQLIGLIRFAVAIFEEPRYRPMGSGHHNQV